MSESNPQVFYSSEGNQPGDSWPSDHHYDDDQPTSFEEAERLERMAGRMIEQAMTAVVVRTCWYCQRRFVKNDGCNEVTCVCGAKTCHKCGRRMDLRHMCQLWLPQPTWYSIRRAAWAAKRHLRHRYPGLRFKYDPSRRYTRTSWRREWERRNRRRNRVTEQQSSNL